jgi:hypothetical protein
MKHAEDKTAAVQLTLPTLTGTFLQIRRLSANRESPYHSQDLPTGATKRADEGSSWLLPLERPQ